jgi:hypothetical protein
VAVIQPRKRSAGHKRVNYSGVVVVSPPRKATVTKVTKVKKAKTVKVKVVKFHVKKGNSSSIARAMIRAELAGIKKVDRLNARTRRMMDRHVRRTHIKMRLARRVKIPRVHKIGDIRLYVQKGRAKGGHSSVWRNTTRKFRNRRAYQHQYYLRRGRYHYNNKRRRIMRQSRRMAMRLLRGRRPRFLRSGLRRLVGRRIRL